MCFSIVRTIAGPSPCEAAEATGNGMAGAAGIGGIQLELQLEMRRQTQPGL